MAKPRILCIDGKTKISEWTRSSLKSGQYPCSVTAVGSGRQAFTILTDRDFDLCIIDRNLPDMNGVQLCTLLKQVGCNVPVLFFEIDRTQTFVRSVRRLTSSDRPAQDVPQLAKAA